MNLRISFLILLLLCTSVGIPIEAEAGPRQPSFSHHGPSPYYRHSYRYGRSDWVGPALFFTLGGLAIGSALATPDPLPQTQIVYVPTPAFSSPSYAVPVYPSPPPPAAVLPTVPPAVAVGVLYYCDSVGGFYPKVVACPEGWATMRRYP